MAKNVQLTVDIKGGDSVGKAAEKTKSLKQELRELKNELASGNLTGKAFDEATARAAKLSDTIIDVNNRVKALATDGADVVLRGFGDMATGIVGGFAAAQGAMALFGSENEDLQKTLVKLQGATALLNGLQQVNATLQGDSAAMVALNTAKTKILTFVQLRYAAAVGTSTGAMKALRIVGMTLGIGVIVAAVGLLIANFDKVKAVVMGVVDRFKGLSGTTKNILSVMFPFIGVIRLVYAGLEKLGAFAETAADRYEKLEKANQKQSKQMEREIDLMEAQGATARDLYLAKHRQLMLDYETMEAKRKLIGLTTEEQEAQKDLANSINILNAQETKRQNDDAKKRQDDANKANDEAVKKRKEAQDKKVEQQKKDAEEIKKLIADEREKQRERDLSEQAKEIDALQDAAKEKMLIAKGNAEAEKLIRENLSKDIAALNEKYRLEAAEKKKEQDAKDKEDEKAIKDKKLQDEKDYADQTLAVTQAIEDSKVSIAQQGAQLLNQVAGQSKGLALAALAIEKGAAIASVIINTQRAIAGYTAAAAQRSALTAGATTAFDTALAAKQITLAKIGAGISIASISAAGISGARNITSGGGSSGGGGSVQPPNIRGSQTTNEPTSQPATKVFVTETDIRSVTRKVDGIFTQATIQ
jgi:hypothetical protein